MVVSFCIPYSFHLFTLTIIYMFILCCALPTYGQDESRSVAFSGRYPTFLSFPFLVTATNLSSLSDGDKEEEEQQQDVDKRAMLLQQTEDTMVQLVPNEQMRSETRAGERSGSDDCHVRYLFSSIFLLFPTLLCSSSHTPSLVHPLRHCPSFNFCLRPLS